jgi:hypothetical protein
LVLGRLRRDMYEQIRNLAFHARLSQSSIVEIDATKVPRRPD